MMDSESDEIEIIEMNSTTQAKPHVPANQGNVDKLWISQNCDCFIPGSTNGLKFIHFKGCKQKQPSDDPSDEDLSDELASAPTKLQSKRAKQIRPRKDDTKDDCVFTVYLEIHMYGPMEPQWNQNEWKVVKVNKAWHCQ